MKTEALLNSHQHRVMDLRSGEADGKRHTQHEIATILGITRQRVQQIEAEVWHKLRDGLKGSRSAVIGERTWILEVWVDPGGGIDLGELYASAMFPALFPGIDQQEFTAGQAILHQLRKGPAHVKNLVTDLANRIRTHSGDPRSAIYSGLQALKKNGKIRLVPGQTRVYERAEQQNKGT